MQDLRPSAESAQEADAGHEGPLQELRRHQVENDTMTLSPIKACPFCGRMNIKYMDPEVPVYAYCDTCKTWVSGGRDFDPREVRYIIQKIKSLRISMEKLE